MSVVPHGVPVIDTHKMRAPGAGLSLLYAGHLLKRNNVRSIVESLNVLVHREGLHGVSLTIVRVGPERASISRSIRERGLEAHVTMKPFLTSEDLAREMKHADLFLLLSKSEAMALSCRGARAGYAVYHGECDCAARVRCGARLFWSCLPSRPRKGRPAQHAGF